MPTGQHPPHCVHALDGRVRVKAPGVKGDPAMADHVQRALLRLEGVRTARANPVTGSILVEFESCRIGTEDICACLHELGCLGEDPYHDPGVERVVDTVTSAVVKTALQAAFSRLLFAGR